jgi:hypothetical protein
MEERRGQYIWRWPRDKPLARREETHPEKRQDVIDGYQKRRQDHSESFGFKTLVKLHTVFSLGDPKSQLPHCLLTREDHARSQT